MGTKYDPTIHHRRSIRLRGYDYSQEGAYFLTICVQNRECLFGEIQDDLVNLNGYGNIVDQGWHQLPIRFNHVEIDESVIMPNHFHGIVVIHANTGGGTPSQQDRPVLGEIVAYFKYQTTKRVNQLRNTPGQKVWQRNYYEHIIRSEASLDRLRHYIRHNPQQWAVDQLHPQVPSKW
jgi:REP element-mobilizing transposase RayT